MTGSRERRKIKRKEKEGCGGGFDAETRKSDG